MATGTVSRPAGDDIIKVYANANTQKTITVENGTRFLLVFATATAKGLYIFNTPNAGGALTYETIKAASTVTIDVATNNTLKVSTTTTGVFGLFVFWGKATLA